MVLDRFHQLDDAGLRVRVRLARANDRAGLEQLVRQLGLTADEFELRRALRFAPGRRWCVVATAWDGHCDRLVGFGARDEARLTLVAAAPGVAGLLRRALDEHARTWQRRVA